MSLPAIIQGLLKPEAYPHAATAVRLIETHISWVLLAGDFAYKIKKPVDFGFLDFSTLDKRHTCCQEEIRLNSRLAPDIYLDVVPITGTSDTPRIGQPEDAPALEWAVRMRAFPADATLDREDAVIDAARIDAIADRIARFHRQIDVAPEPYGTEKAVMHPVLENFAQMRGMYPEQDKNRALIERLAAWSDAEGARLQAHFECRRRDGFVRECHGDLHLGNIAWVDGAPLIFDCIEFNPGLRFVDITSETAFLFMDLVSRGLDALAWRFLNRWLEHTGDYDGLAALPFYLSYRAVVRAKVAALRATQGDRHQDAEVQRYLNLAEGFTVRTNPRLILMHGCSGSGKSWLSQQLLEAAGAIRLRSDVERKRLFGLDALDDSRVVPGGIYTPKAGRDTFARLRALAGSLLDLGHTVIVDATFLSYASRHDFFELADARACPIWIVSLTGTPEQLHSRIRQRMASGGDASEADHEVLDAQLRNAEPLDVRERQATIEIGLNENPNLDDLVARLNAEISS